MRKIICKQEFKKFILKEEEKVMLKIIKRKLINIGLAIINLVSFLKILSIENLAKIKSNASFQVNSQKFINICLITIFLLIFVNVFFIFKDIENKG